ncbi:hypothetical protein hairong_143 [Pseudomonas phage hairong]|nr:hypothetical protein hairong_143 [Pseudomonas phage hairong]
MTPRSGAEFLVCTLCCAVSFEPGYCESVSLSIWFTAL